MTEVPKIVHDRLRVASLGQALPGQGAPERAHPDADLLTAFAEQALSATERDGVLEHLSLCGDCRDVVALALPAEEIRLETNTFQASPLPAKVARNWLGAFTAPSLRWAVVAAGVVIIAGTLAVHSVRVNQARLMSSKINPQVATNASPTTSFPHSPAPAMPSPIKQSPIDQSPIDHSVAMLATAKAPKPQMHASKKVKTGGDVTPSPHAQPPLMLAGNEGAPASAGKVSAAPAQLGANETVEVAAGSAGVQVETSSASENVLMAQNDTPSDTPPVIKAKPVVGTGSETNRSQEAASPGPSAPLPLQGRNMMSRAASARPASQPAANSVSWTITAGALQRSLDGGLTWQNAMHTNHPLLCFANREQEVWTGGQAGVLFHSADSGLTWTAVQPTVKARQLTSDITNIELRGRLEIFVSTVSNEVWRSPDGGRTWEN